MSSDSHKAVTIWRIRLKQGTALEPEQLGHVLTAALIDSTKPFSSAPSGRALINASELTKYLPGQHEGFLSQLVDDVKLRRSSSRGRREGRARRTSDLKSDAWNGAIDFAQCDTNLSDRILRVLGAALWEQTRVEHLCSYKNHEDACLSLTFVPGRSSMLCWAEERGRVHLCDVRQPYARQCVHLSTLPMQVAFAKDGVSITPASATYNWGLGMGSDTGSTANEDGGPVSLKLQPAPDIDLAPTPSAQGCDKTHALSILQHAMGPLSTGVSTVPVAMLLGLARGERLRVPKHLAQAGRSIQEAFDLVLNDGTSPCTELAVLVRCIFFCFSPTGSLECLLMVLCSLSACTVHLGNGRGSGAGHAYGAGWAWPDT